MNDVLDYTLRDLGDAQPCHEFTGKGKINHEKNRNLKKRYKMAKSRVLLLHMNAALDYTLRNLGDAQPCHEFTGKGKNKSREKPKLEIKICLDKIQSVFFGK
ncbi:hypothetical protein SUGI_1177440 [Cryptomeria japonica]|nr:hypothetical protein SUGI_1177440 [Cryptomeria japonica]